MPRLVAGLLGVEVILVAGPEKHFAFLGQPQPLGGEFVGLGGHNDFSTKYEFVTNIRKSVNYLPLEISI